MMLQALMSTAKNDMFSFLHYTHILQRFLKGEYQLSFTMMMSNSVIGAVVDIVVGKARLVFPPGFRNIIVAIP